MWWKKLHWKLFLCFFRNDTTGPEVGPRVCSSFFFFSILVHYRVAVCSGWDGDRWLLKYFYLCQAYILVHIQNGGPAQKEHDEKWTQEENLYACGNTFTGYCSAPLSLTEGNIKINHCSCWAAKSMAKDTTQTMQELFEGMIRKT